MFLGVFQTLEEYLLIRLQELTCLQVNFFWG